MDYKEISGKSFEDAISEACETFGVTSDDIEYEIVDMGTTGFLGIGSKPTVIRARVKEEALKKADAAKSEEAEETKKPEVKEEVSEVKEEIKAETAEEPVSSVKSTDDAPQVNGDEVCKAAREFLENVFKAMDIEVEIDIKYNSDNKELDIDLEGKEMGVLIGKRGQTLDSLQYLVSLVVNKEKSGYIRVKVDTENYRHRRKATLENLAKNLAFKVKRTKRPVTLEPMNPYERRIIHSAIQSDRYVTTHSEGEEPYRRIVITLK